ncbi:hypothetical protein KM043_000726 [Ampulex compressa]|nr:hypothetical protein KM043_000726 [Ampulex compressa]
MRKARICIGGGWSAAFDARAGKINEIFPQFLGIDGAPSRRAISSAATSASPPPPPCRRFRTFPVHFAFGALTEYREGGSVAFGKISGVEAIRQGSGNKERV